MLHIYHTMLVFLRSSSMHVVSSTVSKLLCARHGDVMRLAALMERLVASLAGLAELEHLVLHVLLGGQYDLCVSCALV
jgi:hypothetical protein